MCSEAILWRELRDKHMLGYVFERGVPIDRYSLDFYCEELGLAVAVDAIIRTNVRLLRNGERRCARLLRLGITVLRFSEDEVAHNLDGVVGSIRRWIRNQPIRPGGALSSSVAMPTSDVRRRLRARR